MKIFLSKRLGDYKVTKNALRHYSLYRRCSIGGTSSFTDLVNFHIYESIGELPEGVVNFTAFSKTNAFANGKWIMRLTQDQIYEDICSGNFVRAEFINSTDLEKEFKCKLPFRFTSSGWFTKKLVQSFVGQYTFFPHSK